MDKSVAHPKESESKTPIALEEFKVDDNKISYEIEFSNNKTKITIKGKEIFKGAIVQNKDNQLVYDLIEGTFAGGRFIFFDKESKEGELIIYGSGVPIIKSERGKMILK